MRTSPFVIVTTFAALIVVGLALATLAPKLGTMVAVAGIVLLAAYLLTVFRVAWNGDQKRAWDPGSLYREHGNEQAAKRK
jgi:hypothetical protein